MKKTAILSILLSLCMVVTLLTGIPASAAMFDLDSYADIPTHIEPNENGYNYYFFTMEEAGTLTVTGNTSFELGSRDDDSKYGFTEYDMGGTVSLQVVAGERMKLTYGYNDKGIDLVVTFEAGVAEEPGEGGEDDGVDTSVLDGVYNVVFSGSMVVFKVTFNNGVMTVEKVENVGNDVSGTYNYTVVDGIPVADCNGAFTISKNAAGNLTFQPSGFAVAMDMVKIAELGGDEGGEGGEGDEGDTEAVGVDGVYNAVFSGSMVTYKLTFNNGTLTVEKVENVGNDVSGTYTYTVVDGIPVVDCDGAFAISQNPAGNLTFQPSGFMMPMELVRIGDVEGGDEPVNPPATTEPITVWGPDHMNEEFSNGSIAAGQTQEYLIYDIVKGDLVITGSNLTVVFNGETYTTSRWNNTITIPVSEEDLINLDENDCGYAALSVSSSQGANYTVKFEFPLGHGQNPENLDNLLKVPTILPADNVDGYYYTWTADFTGTLTLYMNQGIEGVIVDLTIYDEGWNNHASLYSWETETLSDSLTIEVEEGVEYTIYVIEYPDEDGNKKGGNIIFSNREELTATGAQDDPFTLEEGDMDLIMEAGKSSDGFYYTYMATGNGILTVTIQNWDGTRLIISGMTDQGNGVYTLEVESGKMYTINTWLMSDAACDMDLTVTFTDESEIEYELGTEQNPEAIDSIDGLEFTMNNSGYYYVWTATESGTLVITLNTDATFGYNVLVNGESLYGNGNTLEIDVQEGDEIVVVNTMSPAASSNTTVTLSSAFDNGEVEDGPIVPAGDYTFVVFAMMVMSMAALVVLVSKKRAF